MPYNTITPLAGGQLHPAKTDKSDTLVHDEIDKSATPARDDTDALLDVAREAAAAGLVPDDLIDRMEVYRAFGGSAEAQADLAAALGNGPAAVRALDSILAAFQPGDVVEISALDPAEKERGLSRNCDLSTPEGRASLEAFIREHIGHRNLYFGANPRNADLAGTGRHATNADVAARRTAFVDMDLKDAPDVDPGWTRTRAELEALGPVLLVETGNGFHAHFRVEDLTGEALAASVPPLEQAMAALGSDNMADPRRIARLPWTVNLPKENKRARGAVPALARPVDPKAGTLPPAPRPVEDLSAAIVDVATRLALPGRKSGRGADGSASAPTARTGEKTGWAAPSVDLLRMAMEEMPNDGPFDNRDDFMYLAHAVKGAAMAGGIEAEGREIWLDWCARWHGPADPVKDAAAWDGIRNPHTGWGTIKRLLEQHNAAGAQRVSAATAQAAYPPLPDLGLQTFAWRPMHLIPPREWLYGKNLERLHSSVLVAAPGVGKSALALVEVLAMASGKTLLPPDKPYRPMVVWYHNAEDPTLELERRVASAAHFHQLSPSDVRGRLFVTGRETEFRLAQEGKHGPEEITNETDRFIREIKRIGAEVVVLDPMSSFHSIDENSSRAMAFFFSIIRRVMDETGTAIMFVHHAGKAAGRDMDAAGADAGRGSSAIVGAVRNSRQGRKMTSEEARKLGVPDDERWRLVRVDNGKTNNTPPSKARWVRLETVTMGNGSGYWPDGDDTQAVAVWTPPAPKTLNTPANAWACYQALAGADVSERRLDVKSPGWVGFIFADALGLDVGSADVKTAPLTPDQSMNRDAIKALIAAGDRSGWIVRREEYLPSNKRKGEVFAAGEAPPEPKDDPDADLVED